MIQLSRKSLADGLAALQSVAERKATIPILGYVMFGLVGDVLTLTATDMDVTMVTEMAAQGDSWGGCLPSGQLYALVKLLTDDTLTFKPVSNRMEITCGRARHKLPILSISEFPEVDRVEGESATVPATTFATMLDHVAFAIMPIADSHSQSSHRFTGVNVTLGDGELRLTATNITRFATVAQPVDAQVQFDVIVPQQAIGALRALSTGTLAIDATENYAHFTNGTRHVYSRLIDGKFPDWRALFPAEYEHSAQLVTAELGSAIKRALLTSTEGKHVKDGLRWTWAGNELLIETRGGDKGKSDEVVEVTCESLNGSSVVLGINGQQVIDALGLLGDKVTCRFSNGTNIVELTPTTPTIPFTYFVNTVSLRNWQ